VGVLNAPVPADVGEEVFRRGLFCGQAGDVEDGLGAGVPLAFLLVRGVALDQDGQVRVLEAGFPRCGQDADGAGLDAAAAELAGGGGDRGRLPGQGAELRVQVRLVAEDGPQVVRVLRLPQPTGVAPRTAA
jgi:hypothetical protein